MKKGFRLFIFTVVSMFFYANLHAQSIRVSGVVKNALDGTPLPGVTIAVRKANIFTITDSDGKYTINVPSGTDVLEFSLIGFRTVSEPVANRNAVNIQMQDDVQTLDEVIVIGYGTGQKLGTVVGSVAKVSSDNIKERPSSNVLDALQGKISGIQIYTSSGEPSAAASIRFHGTGSLGASSAPLYVVDGITIDSGSFTALNKNNFESITFLKDASATSIYGARAANGVIYVTTKKGKANTAAEISFTGQYSLSSMANKDFFNHFMNSKQLTDFWVETGFRTREAVDKLLEQYPYDTKWIDYYYKDNVPSKDVILSVSGGGGKTTYYLSGAYYGAEGIAPRSSYSRYTLHTNVESQAKTWLKLGLNMTLAYGLRNTNGWGSSNTNGGLFWLTQPFYTPYDPKTGERYDYIPGAQKYSPWYIAEKYPVTNNDIRMTGSLYAEISPVKGLTIRSQHGLDGYDQRYTSIRMPSYLGNLNNGTRSENFYRNYIFTMTNTAEYKFSVKKDHQITVLGGQEYIDSDYMDFSGSSAGIIDDRLNQLGNGPSSRSVSQSHSQYAYFSLFGRVNYSFDGKYHANINVREDRSSRFGKNNRSAVFVSGGAMWDVKKENFLKDLKLLSDLKLRVSYGSSGNSSIGNYDHLATVGTNQYAGQTGWAISSPGNPSLSWETQNTLSFSLSATLVDRLNIDMEYYDRRTTNMLMSVPYPYTSGFTNIYSNVGKLQNRGVDLALNYDIISTSDWKVNVSATFSYNANKVLELFQGRNQWTVANSYVSYVVGKPIMFYSALSAGIDPQTGDQKWYLPNEKDNSITTRDENRTTATFSAAALEQNTGKPRFAPISGGFGFYASYKGLRIDTYFSYTLDKYMINNDRSYSSNPATWAGSNQHVEVLDYWKKPGDIAKFPRYGQALQTDDHLLENASFMRMKTLTLSYALPKSLLNKTRFFDHAKVFVTGRNLLTVTNYKGPDPEVDTNLSTGAYPNTKQYSFGIELKF